MPRLILLDFPLKFKNLVTIRRFWVVRLSLLTQKYHVTIFYFRYVAFDMAEWNLHSSPDFIPGSFPSRPVNGRGNEITATRQQRRWRDGRNRRTE